MKKSTKTILKILLGIVLVVAIAVGVAAAKLYIGLEGSPFDRMKVKKSAREYLEKEYSQLEPQIDSVDFDYKRNVYEVSVISKTSQDSHFELEMGGSGELIKDRYSEQVQSGRNTFYRISDEYENWIRDTFEKVKPPYKMTLQEADLRDERIYPGEDHVIKLSGMKVDENYDLFEQGKKAGEIVVVFEQGRPTAEELEKMLIESKKYLDEQGLSFYQMSVGCCEQKDEKSSDEQAMILEFDITYDEIGSEGFLAKLKEVAK